MTANRKRILQTLPALFAFTALFVVGGQVINPAPAKALDVVTCTGSGDGKTIPAINASPNNVEVENVGPYSSTCTGAGVTAAKATFDAHAVFAFCSSVVTPIAGDIYVGAEAAGKINVKWTGGKGGETVFSWVIAGATQVGPGVSVIAVTGLSSSGTYHEGTPAHFNALVTVNVPAGSCASAEDTFATSTTFIMTNLI